MDKAKVSTTMKVIYIHEWKQKRIDNHPLTRAIREHDKPMKDKLIQCTWYPCYLAYKDELACIDCPELNGNDFTDR